MRQYMRNGMMLKGVMKMKYILIAMTAVVVCAGCGPSMPEGVSHFDKYDERLGDRTPVDATNITYKLWTGGLSMSEMLKCHVSKGSFMAFAKKNDWVLRSDTYSYNSRTKIDDGCDVISWLLREFDGTMPTNYLSYNYIYTNNGGITVLYDVDHEIMYYSDSTN